MDKNKIDKIFDLMSRLAQLSLILLVVLALISITQNDCRYGSIGVMLFSVVGIGHAPFWLIYMYIRDRRTDGIGIKIFSVITIITLVLIMISVFLFGLSMYLHHYDNNYLLDVFIDVARWVDKL